MGLKTRKEVLERKHNKMSAKKQNIVNRCRNEENLRRRVNLEGELGVVAPGGVVEAASSSVLTPLALIIIINS